jgi:hypothetical protein
MDRAESGIYFFNRNHIKIDTIQAFANFAQETIRRAEAGIFDIHAAVEAALAVEEALLEEEVFEQLEGTTEHYRKVISKIKEDSAIHHRKIKEFRDNELLGCAG